MANKPTPKGKAVATNKQSRALAASDSALFFAHSGAGLENVTAKDILVPRIGILQALSPQLIKSKPEYNPEARVGDIYDIGLGERLGEEIMFLPILYKKQYLEWFPRSTGKGLARIHDSDAILAQCSPDERNRPTLENGNYVAETAQFFGLNLSASNRISFIPMAATQLKKARQWLTMSTGEKLPRDDGGEFTPPLFYRIYKLTTQPESNNDGDWVGWKIERGPALPETEGWQALYESLLETHKQLSSGQMKGDVAGLGDEAASNNSSM